MADSTTSKAAAHRRRRPAVVLALLAAVAVGALGLIYVAFFTADAPPPLALSDEPAKTPTTSAGGATGVGTTAVAATDIAGNWRTATGSEARYRVREKLVALPAKSDAVGRTSAVTGAVKVDRAGTSFVATDASFKVDLTRLTSDESRRDNRIRTDGLQTDTFPEATFVTTGSITLPAAAATGEAVKTRAEGDLTLHGVTKRVTIPLDVRLTAGKGELVGSFGFPMSDFSISPPSIGGFVTVDPDATLEFKLLLEKA